MEGQNLTDSVAERLERHLAGETLDAASGEVPRRWTVARDVLRQEVPAPTEWNVSSMWDRVLAEVQRPSSLPVARRRTLVPLRNAVERTARRFAWAVSAVAVATVVWIMVGYRDTPESRIGHVYQTDATHQAALRLSDGTQVMLAPATRLRVADVDGSERAATLERGEAYFDVRAAAASPFVVRAGGVTTTVLGTRFVVRCGAHCTEKHDVHVLVTTGKVRVAAGRTTHTLIAGSVLNVRDSLINVGHVGTLDPNRGLAAENVSVEEVLAVLTRWYGYSFRVSDSSIVRQNVTMWLSTRSSAEALMTLERILDVNLKVRGDTITLVPRQSNRHGAPRSTGYDIWTPTREVGR